MSNTTELIQEAVSLAVSMAQDASHGYAQDNRWGPDYDCSSFLIHVWQSVGVPVKDSGATYTGNMRNTFIACGFRVVTGSVNLTTGAGLQTGDVLLHERNHTAMYIGNGQIVQASGNERGGITGGTPGDQTGQEIHTRSYYNFPWEVILRLSTEDVSESNAGYYTVQAGEGFWVIADKVMGDSGRWRELAAYNGLAEDHVLHPGDILRIPGHEMPESPSESELLLICTPPLPLLKKGNSGLAVRSLQTLLNMRGIEVPVKGYFGEQTDAAVKQFQEAAKLLVDGEVGNDTWAALIG